MYSFYFSRIFIICDKQTFHYIDKVRFILKDATQISFLFSINILQKLMLKLTPKKSYIKFNTPVDQDLQNSLWFLRYTKLKLVKV